MTTPDEAWWVITTHDGQVLRSNPPAEAEPHLDVDALAAWVGSDEAVLYLDATAVNKLLAQALVDALAAFTGQPRRRVSQAIHRRRTEVVAA